jgi:hypothetical protein
MMKQRNQARVIAILYDESQDTPLVLLQIDETDSFITLPIGTFEASSLIMASEALVTPQPLIHDVLVQLLQEHAFKANYVELWGSPISGYFGRFRYQGRLLPHYLTIGPADCLILALRLKLPIFIDATMAATAQKELPKQMVYDSGSSQILYLDAHQHIQTL